MTDRIARRRIFATYDSSRDNRIFINDPTRIDETELHLAVQCRMSVDPRRNRGVVTATNLSERTRDDVSGIITSTLDLRGPVSSGSFGSDLDELGLPRSTANSLADLYTPEQLERGGFFSNPIQKATTFALGGGYCEIDAGLNDEVGRVFEGSVSRVRSRKTGPNWRTSFEIGDGLTTATGSVSNQAFNDGAKTFDVVQHVVRSLGLSIGTLTLQQFQEAVGHNVVSVLPRGYVAVGNSNAVLNQMLQHSGAEWFIDRGTIYIVRKGQPIDPGQTPIVLEQDVEGGIRRSPTPIDGSGILVESDFRRDVRIGRIVETRSRKINGLWRADVVDHRIDNRAGEWITRTILRKIPQVPGLEFLSG
jgi:hypothetical protein